MLILTLITFIAAIVNGGLGYGFSSITAPLALLFLSNRVLNPAIILVEVVLNLMVLWVNKKSIPKVWPHLKFIIVGMIPTIFWGSYILGTSDSSWIKLGTYGVMLPLLFLQVIGIRRPVKINGLFGLGFGAGLGFLYSLTTISGPPLALLFNNEGLEKEDFRAALGIVRTFEACFAAISYYFLGLFSSQSLSISGYIFPSVILGIPIGALLIRKMNAEVFRRICMSFDVIIVGFGLCRVLQQLQILPGSEAYSILLMVIALDGFLLYRFFFVSDRTILNNK